MRVAPANPGPEGKPPSPPEHKTSPCVGFYVLLVDAVGFEGYNKKVNCFTFLLTRALEEKLSLCRRHC